MRHFPIPRTMFSRLLAVLCLVSGMLSCSGAMLYLADGEGVSKASLDSKYLVINHWATWCAPCREEIPELNMLADSLDPGKALVLGYGEDFHTGQALLDDIAEMGIKFPVMTQDPSEIWGYGPSNVLPRTAIIAPGGEVLNILLGPQTRESVQAALLATNTTNRSVRL